MNLLRIRKGIGLTQKQVSLLSNVSEAAISLYENGKRSPNLSTAKRLAEVLGVTVDELVGKDDEQCRSAS